MTGWHGALIQCPSLPGPAYNLVQPEENNFDLKAVGGKKLHMKWVLLGLVLFLIYKTTYEDKLL